MEGYTLLIIPTKTRENGRSAAVQKLEEMEGFVLLIILRKT
jgi:hypothetical protein